MNLPLEINFSRTRAPAVAPELKLAARQRIAQCVQLAHSMGIRMPMPTVSFDLRGRVGGQAYLRSNHVRLNSVLLTENGQKFITQTVGHEVAHLATNYKYGAGVAPHGPEWQAMMVAFGLEPARCHNYDVSNAVVGKTYEFVCSCPKKFVISERRYKSALRGRYKCKKCKKVIQPAGSSMHSASALVPSTKSVTRPQPTAATVISRAILPIKSNVRPPTEAMLRYAHNLAAQTGLKLPLGIESDFSACSQFIEQAKRQPVPLPPTERQLEFAQRLAVKLGAKIPAATLKSRQALSAWLDAHIPKTS